MVVTDPIADLLTRIRNALTAKHETVTVPASKMKKAIADILVEEGFVKSAEIVENDGRSDIVIALKYGAKNEKVISNLKRISKPGLRVYCGYEKLPKVLGGLGIAIISTSKGVMTDKAARNNKIGGEVLAYVW
ncbi:MAG: 30S ribosomal protein S8 [Christensenellales bacterium]|jgi:ribosomal protein S8